MNEVAGRLSDARSKLSLASVATQHLVTKAAEQRGWLRDHTCVRLHGSGPEHDAVRKDGLTLIVIFTCVHVRWAEGCSEPDWFHTAHRVLQPLNPTELARILDGVADLSTSLKDDLIDVAEGNPERLLEAVHSARRRSRVIPAWPVWREAPFGWRALDEAQEDEAGMDSLEMSVLASPDFDS